MAESARTTTFGKSQQHRQARITDLCQREPHAPSVREPDLDALRRRPLRDYDHRGLARRTARSTDGGMTVRVAPTDADGHEC